MIKILRKVFGGSKESKGAAKSRLQFVLVQDRSGLGPKDMADFKSELVKVISKYFVISKDDFDVAYEHADGSTKLLINSPVAVKRNLSEAKAASKGINVKGADAKKDKNQAAKGKQKAATGS